MNQDELSRLIDSNRQVKTVTTEAGLEAGLKLAEIADKAGIPWAFAGGIAMHVYGYVRATTDVDMIAGEVLTLESSEKLSFGGESYRVAVEGDEITVDWIVRDDEHAAFYENALRDALEVKSGLKIISPEWMVILKHLAGRPKDQLDLTWLLERNDLVKREIVIANIKEVLGKYAVFLIPAFQSEFDYADVLRLRGERSKYKD